MVVLLLACTVVLMVRRGRKKVALLHKHTALVSSSTKPGVTINMKDLKMNMALSTPIINNGLSRSRVAAAKSKVGLRNFVPTSVRNIFQDPVALCKSEFIFHS
jgi:discoidin domain receptor family protein 2